MQHTLKTSKKDMPNKGADQKDFQIHYALLSEELKEKTSAHLVIKSAEVSLKNCVWRACHSAFRTSRHSHLTCEFGSLL